METFIKNGDYVLFSCNELDQEVDNFVNNFKAKVGENGKVEKIYLEKLKDIAAKNIYDGIYIHSYIQLSMDLCEILQNSLKPLGILIVKSGDGILSSLKLSGFMNVREEEAFTISQKPGFELGSSLQLKSKSNDELADPDDLLTEEDKAVPDPSSLKVCSTTGQRKACKNCVCGLKEELELEDISKVAANRDNNFKPSCGNCYLGDAFRCAACPYLGTPSFKPGEKVKLMSTMDDLDL